MNARNRKKLFASTAMVVASLALLVGLTFAWFTDSVKSTGNKIQAGTLDISATVASVDSEKGDFTIPGVNGGKAFGFGQATDINESSPIISETLWEPGKSSAKLVTVTNKGDLATKVKLQFDVEDGGLQGALWFDFVQVGENNQITGQFTKRPMSDLATLADQTEYPLAAGKSAKYMLIYGMDETAGNEYQGKHFTADITILAKQDTVEADGFGNTDYDQDATYVAAKEVSVSTPEDFKTALTSNTGSPVNVTLTQSVGHGWGNRVSGLNVTGDITLNVPAFGEEEGFCASDLTVTDGGSLTINGEREGAASKVSAANVNNTITVTGTGSTLTLNNVYSAGQSSMGKTGFAATDGGTLTINGGFYSVSGFEGLCVLADGGTVVITAGSFKTYGSDSTNFKAVNGGKIIIAESAYNTASGYGANPSKISAACKAELIDGNYVITEK